MAAKVRLKRLAGTYAICRLAPTSPIPGWTDGEGFVSISRSEDELSIACRADRVPRETRHAGGWACYRFIGPFAFDETASSVP